MSRYIEMKGALCMLGSSSYFRFWTPNRCQIAIAEMQMVKNCIVHDGEIDRETEEGESGETEREIE